MKGHPTRDPLEVVSDETHLANHVEEGEYLSGSRYVCCWGDPDLTLWRIDMVDGVAVTWCNGQDQEIPF